jgi:hypothetical protein
MHTDAGVWRTLREHRALAIAFSLLAAFLVAR